MFYDWRARARYLRSTGLSIRDVAAEVGKGKSVVGEELRGIGESSYLIDCRRAGCGKPFIASRSRAMYCSERCRYLATEFTPERREAKRESARARRDRPEARAARALAERRYRYRHTHRHAIPRKNAWEEAHPAEAIALLREALPQELVPGDDVGNYKKARKQARIRARIRVLEALSPVEAS